MEYKICKNFFTVKTKKRLGETEKLKTCGGVQWDYKERYFLCPLNVDFIRKFISVFGLKENNIFNLLNSCIKRDNYYKSVIDKCNYLRNNPNVDTPVDKLGSFAKGMRRIQKIALYASLSIPRFGLFLDRGVGKSKVIIDNLSIRLLDNKIKKALVVCPRLNINNTWIPEFKKHLKISNLPIIPIVGNKKQKIDLLQSEHREVYVHVMTYDTLRIYESFLGSYDFIAFDESKQIAGKSKRNEAAFNLSTKAKYVIAATGSVSTLKTGSDIFNQYKVMDLGATFGLKYFNFQEEYFVDVGKWYPKWVPKRLSIDLMREKMFCKAISVKKEECLDLPLRTFKSISVSLSKSQLILMNGFAEGFNHKNPDMELKNLIESYRIDYCKEALEVNDAPPISKVVKCQEITSGFYKPYTDKNNLIKFDSLKLDALVETIKTLTGSKVIVWTRFLEDIDRISSALTSCKIKSYVVNGKKDEVKKWQKSKSVDILLGIESIGKGLTLNEAAYMIYYSYDFSLENWNQSLDRNYRDGQKMQTVVYIIKAEDTADVSILKSLRRNQEFSDKITKNNFVKIIKGK